MTDLSVLEGFVLVPWVVYLSVLAMLNSSIGLRMGYNCMRIIPVSVVWPLLAVNRVNEWAKRGSCTLREGHPIRTD